VFYFSKLFKKKNGVSPKYYRQDPESINDTDGTAGPADPS